jgi:copper resistance protein B
VTPAAKRRATWVCLGIIFVAWSPARSQDLPPPGNPAPAGGSETSSETQHASPDPPAHVVPTMSYKAMSSMMEMDDTGRSGSVLLDEFEWRSTDQGAAGVWEAEGWYGDDYNKLWIRSEGEQVAGITEDARVEALWDRIVTRWWSLQLGARQDLGKGPDRTWAALGVQGLAPQWFDVEATLYAADAGRTAVRLRAEYDLLITQRLIVQPEAEANLYGKSDPARQIGSGLSDLDVGVRMRYEIRREFAPYVGVAWQRRFGRTAEFTRAAGMSASDVQFLAGIRIWF